MSFGEELQSHVRDRYLDALSTIYFPIVRHILLYQNLPAQYTNLATKALNVQASRILYYNIDFHHHGGRQSLGHMFSSAVVLLVVENLSCVTETGIYPVKSRDAIAKVKRVLFKWAGCCRFAWKALNIV